MKKFLTQFFAIATSLGLQAKVKDHKLSDEDQATLKAAYDKAHGEGAFDKDCAEFEAAKQKETEASIFALLSEALGQSNVENAQLKDILDGIAALKDTVASLGQKAEPDQAAAQAEARANFGLHTKDYAFGIKNDIFAAAKRHNYISISGSIPAESPSDEDKASLRKDFGAFATALAKRYQTLCKSGRINELAKGVDLSGLSKIDFNERAYEVRQDMLIARIVALPSLRGIFPTVSRVQSGQVFTNLLAKAVSQAYQSGRVFKGGVSFEPEKAYTDKVMAKIQFEDMSDLETSYLNYLNTNGSDPVKLSMIEWIVLSLATQLNNERNERSVMGFRVEPQAGKAGHEMFASTGVVYRLLMAYLKEHKVLPFKSAALASYDATNFGDVLKAFAAELQKAYKRPQDLVVYLNEAHKPMLNAWLNANYGKNTGFIPAADTIPDYGYRIKWVPNEPFDFHFIFATVENNIHLLENIPGEEFDMKFQRDLEEVLVFSYWKEGAAAAFAGVAESDYASLEFSGVKGRQIIFMNWPASTLEGDATEADASDSRIFVTSANSGDTKIEDIKKAEEGVIYIIVCGSAVNPTGISKAGKMSISKDWTPTAEGEWIALYYDQSENKFFEAARG